MLQGFPTPSKYKVLVRCNTFNQAKYIEDSLKGFAMQQTDFPFLVYVIDDASKDGEQDVLRNWIDNHCNQDEIQVYDNDLAIILMSKDKDNENCIYAIHLLKKNLFMKPEKQELHKIWRDQCEYEASCEGDDYWIDPLKLKKQIDYMDKHPECSLCHTSFSFFFQESKVFKDNDASAICKEKTNVCTVDLLNGYTIQTATALIRLDMYENAINIDPFLFSGYFKMGDLILWWLMLKVGTFHFIPDVTAIYRKNEGSSTRSKGGKRYRFYLSMRELDYYLLNRDGIYPIELEKCKNHLHKALINYLAFDHSFKNKIGYNQTLGPLEGVLVKTGILKMLLLGKDKILAFVNNMRHRIK